MIPNENKAEIYIYNLKKLSTIKYWKKRWRIQKNGDIHATVRRSTIYIIGIPEDEEKENAEAIFEEIMARNF